MAAELLRTLLVDDNAARDAAQAAYEQQLAQAPAGLIAGMLMILAAPDDPAPVRNLCAVLLRRCLVESDLWLQLDAGTQAGVKAGLLEYLEARANDEPWPPVLHAVCEVVGELGLLLLPEQQWPELAPFLAQSVTHGGEAHKESALRIFTVLAEVLASQTDQFEFMLGVFQHCLGGDRAMEVRLAALRALTAVMVWIPDTQGSVRGGFQPLMPAVAALLDAVVASGVWAAARDALEQAISLAEVSPRFFMGAGSTAEQRQSLGGTVAWMAARAVDGALDAGVRRMCLEVLTALAEAAPKLCRRVRFAEQVFPVCLEAMLAVPAADERWAMTNDSEDVMGFLRVGADALDRMAATLGRSAVAHGVSLAAAFMERPDWQCRHAALRALACLVEFVDDDPARRAEVVPMVLAGLADGAPQVRHAAIEAAGQLAIDHAPDFQSEYHAQVLPLLLARMEEQNIPRIQCHAGAALMNFVSDAQVEHVQPHLPALLAHIEGLLNTGPRFVQEQAVSTLCAAADRCGELFVPHYERYLALLKQVLDACTGPDDRALRGVALEGIGIIGSAVGKERFAPYAAEVMSLMVQAQQAPLDADDPMKTSILNAWCKMCECLGADFAPYLPHVMPYLIDAASVNEALEGDDYDAAGDDDDDDGDGDEVLEIAVGNGPPMRVRTSTLEDKAKACRVLYCLVRDLREHFCAYVESTTRAIAPLLCGSAHSDIRTHAVTTMAELVRSASRALPDQRESVAQLLSYALNQSLRMLVTERDMEAVKAALVSVGECVENASEDINGGHDAFPTAVLNAAQLTAMVDNLLVVLRDAIQRRAIRRASQTVDADDYDQEALEKDALDAANDDQLLFEWHNTVEVLFKTHREAFWPAYTARLHDLALGMADEQCIASDKHLALLLIDDAIEFCAPTSLELLPAAMPILFRLATWGDNPDVCQAAVSGLQFACVAAGNAGRAAEFAQYVPDVARRLFDLRADPAAAADPDAAWARDMVVAVAAVFLARHTADVGDDQLVGALFQQAVEGLPLQKEAGENPGCMLALCDFVAARVESPVVAPLVPAFVHRLVAVAGAGGGVSTPALVAGCGEFLRGLQASAPQAAQAAWAALPGDMQQKAQALLSASASASG